MAWVKFKFILGVIVALASGGAVVSGQVKEQRAEEIIDYVSEDGVQYDTTGPAKGSLVIVGGSMNDPAILDRFFELGGGKDQPYIVVPTAGADIVSESMKKRAASMLTRAGATNVTVLHTKDRDEANSKDFLKPIKSASGVWFGGGRQWRIADSYLGTKTEDEFHKLLERGGVIGGSSAGATIQGSYLARGDSKTNVIMMGDHEEGFSFVKNIAIDQHLLQRNRQFDLVEIVKAKPELLGVGIDENTAIVVTGNEFEVVGPSYVAVFDHKRWHSNNEKKTFQPFFLLRGGDRFNMKKRQVTWDGSNRGNNAIFSR
jgi:cyanophycinase